MSCGRHQSSRLQRLPPSLPVSSSGAARRKSLPVATTPWRSAEGKAQGRPRPQRLPPSVSVSSSGAARRKALPVAITPRRSAQRKAEVARGMEHLPLLSPGCCLTLRSTRRPPAARQGREAVQPYHRPRGPGAPLAVARYLKR